MERVHSRVAKLEDRLSKKMKVYLHQRQPRPKPRVMNHTVHRFW